VVTDDNTVSSSSGIAILTIMDRIAPTITSDPAPNTIEKLTDYWHQFTATGYPATITWGISGALPNGLTWDAATATITGTPDTVGTSALITVTASNGVLPDAEEQFTIEVTGVTPSIYDQPDDITVNEGEIATFTIGATIGGDPLTYQWYLNAAVIPGETDTTYTIDPTTGAMDGDEFYCEVTNPEGSVTATSDTATLTVMVDTAPTITSAMPGDGVEGVFYSHLFSATGYPEPTWSTADALPPGLSLSTGGALTGIPTAVGTYGPITVTADNGVVPASDQVFAIDITAVSIDVEFSAADFPIEERDSSYSAVTVSVTISRAEATYVPVSVDYATSDGSATVDDEDYDAALGRLTWLGDDNDPKTFTVLIRGDTAREPDETFNVILSNPMGATIGAQGTSTVTILDDDLVNSSLVAWYKFDNNADDSSVMGNHGTLSAGAYEAGILGSAVRMTGANVVTVFDSASLRVNEFTLSTWVNPDVRYQDMGAARPRLFSKENVAGMAGYGVGTMTDNSNFLGLQVLSDPEYTRATYKEERSMPVAWYNLTATYDGNWLRVYLDGVLQEEFNNYWKTAPEKFIKHDGTALTIGEGFEGLMDDARVYNRALSEAEINELLIDPAAPEVGAVRARSRPATDREYTRPSVSRRSSTPSRPGRSCASP